MVSNETITKNNTVPHLQNDDFLNYAANHGFGDLHFKMDAETGMIAIIAIHSTKLGPALGGCRFIEYPTTMNAIFDAMRLARGMSFKAASVNLPLGGGKSVIIKPRHTFDRSAYFHAFGKFVNELNGRYITALDSGTQLSDMDIIAEHTPYVASLSSYNGDPSPYTAQGVFQGIKTTVLFKLGKIDLTNVHIAIQGLGHVGFLVAQKLYEAGAKLTVADINKEVVDKAVREFGARSTSTHTIHQVQCDVFSPCALGATINEYTIEELQTSIIAGAANNQLAHTHHGQILHDKKITYAPDYVINSGGLIFAASKYLKTSSEEVTQKIETIGDSLMEIYLRAQQDNKPINEVADLLAEEKLS